MYNLFIKTLGCQMNEYDSARIQNLLSVTYTCKKVYNATDANLLILNTCSIREKAYYKVFSILGTWRLLKIKDKNIIICVVGCVAQQLGKLIFKYAPFVDLVIGTQSYSYFPELLSNYTINKELQLNIDFNTREKFSCFYSEAVITTGFVTVMEGCDKFCTYCVVPFTRGIEVSRPFDDIIVEIVTLVNFGVTEIVLLGQNVNAYNGDFYNGDFVDFSYLIKNISNIHGVERIKFLTSHPSNFKQSLINLFQTVSKISSFLHLPVQSGSDFILGMMNRCYSILEYKVLLRKLKNKRLNLSYGTDIIVGFPKETHFDFYKTCFLFKEFIFDHSYSFLYSPRPGTVASTLIDCTSKEIKQKRLLIIQRKVNGNVNFINRSILGTIQRIIISGFLFSSINIAFGYTDNNRLVCIRKLNLNIGETILVKILFYSNSIFYVDFYM